MDTSHLEHIAEDHVSHVLQKQGFLVAKPRFDVLGTDLLAFIELKDGVKFARVQCKGRMIDYKTEVTVSSEYVSDGFVLFLYLLNEARADWLHCFFASEIRAWTMNSKREYTLSIPRDSHETKFRSAAATPLRIAALRHVIEQAEVHGEFRHLSLASVNIAGGSGEFSGSVYGAPSGV